MRIHHNAQLPRIWINGPGPHYVFFGAIPDRFNLLVPGHPPTQIDKQFAANNINQWTLYNTVYSGGADAVTSSLGAFTTAPDGTNTAQKIVETTTNSVHSLTALPTIGDSPGVLYDMRLAVFAKAAERTRIVLKIEQTSTFFQSSRTVFDLAGGQVAVPGTAVGGGGFDYVPIQDIILPFGNGWYLCMIDVKCNAGTLNQGQIAYFELDAGSGTAAIDNSYTGDGTSGVYTWRSTMLPPAAWGMSGQRVFFDDFDDPTLSQIDLTNSRAPGFTWYINNEWPGYRSGSSPGSPGSPNAPTDPTIYEFSSPSYLKIVKKDTGFNTLGIGTAAWDGGTGYVGTGHQLSNRLIEAKLSFTHPAGDDIAFWATVINDIATHDKFPADGNYAYQYRELDMLEQIGEGTIGANDPQSTFISGTFILGQVDQTSFIQSNQIGAHKWGPFNIYQASGVPADTLVHYNGVVYQCIQNGTNHQPDISPTYWQTPPGAAINLPADIDDIYQYDYGEQNIYSILWLEETATSPGCAMTFFNGIHCRSVSSRGSFINYNPTKTSGDACNLQLMEGQLFLLWFTCLISR